MRLRCTTTRILLAVAISVACLVGVTSVTFAEPAKLKGVSNYVGKCSIVNNVNSKANNINSYSCDPEVSALHFLDGYTSVQFRASNNDNKIMTVAFVGPRWFRLDDLHTSMVVDQVIFSSGFDRPALQKPYSGFCMFQFDKPDGQITRYRCEYLSRDEFSIFELSEITSRIYHDTQN